MDSAPSIIELVRNGTLSAEMAALLWAAVDERRSFLSVAIPRLAGKTTVSNAILALLDPSVPVHRLSGDEAEMARLGTAATGGYLVVGEFSQAPVPSYIWGAPVRRVFETLEAGYSLATALHAPGLEETFDVICAGNGVSDQAASRIDLMLYIRRFGAGPETFWRRLAEIHEVEDVERGRPRGRLLFRWVEEDDRFETVEQPLTLRADAEELQDRAEAIAALAQSGRTAA
ncbi:MAG: hypothetical protein V3S00_00420, partial [Dehalococcoidia bacterium]